MKLNSKHSSHSIQLFERKYYDPLQDMFKPSSHTCCQSIVWSRLDRLLLYLNRSRSNTSKHKTNLLLDRNSHSFPLSSCIISSADITACSSFISDDTRYRIGSMINCLTLTCVVTIRIVDKENYKQGKRDQSWIHF
jgi:hypothetical protein